MQIHNKLKNPVISGALLLTAAGILGKIIGFFYRIFLSRTIGAEGLGIYQLIFPISTICFAITVSGLSTSLSKFIAEYKDKDPTAPKRFLRACLLLSGILSLAAMFVLFRYSSFIAKNILLEPRCEPLIPILACSIPFASVHSCIHGYYYGKKKAGVPAVSSFIEQFVRVFFVFLLYQIHTEQGKPMDASAAVWGLVFGEAGAFLFCMTALLLSKDKALIPSGFKVQGVGRKLVSYSIPLSMNRLALTLFASFESILIPSRLGLFGYSQSDALSVYGVLTGMALSIIMFPTVLTNSVSVMILPVISEADSKHNTDKISQTIYQTIFACLLFGSLCTAGFLFTGNLIGDYLFGNALAGKFIRMLSFICPFLFLSSVLSSILHGLGMPGYPFILNMAGSLMRICFVYFLIPVYGIRAYLIGLLLSQVVISVCYVGVLWKKRLQGNQ
ncbi:MAG: polysaccharide biosynthesis protein [Eubacterium sp.]|nr:polysaccharide biosynthesis protein [Eubacterium sp.]NBI84844.1 polysaccharide biosynthesis protein [Lachnospiraceae bacterium]